MHAAHIAERDRREQAEADANGAGDDEHAPHCLPWREQWLLARNEHGDRHQATDHRAANPHLDRAEHGLCRRGRWESHTEADAPRAPSASGASADVEGASGASAEVEGASGASAEVDEASAEVAGAEFVSAPLPGASLLGTEVLLLALVNNDSSSAAAAIAVEDLIRSMPPGSRLPSYRQLQQRYRLGPATVQRMLADLATRGLLVTRPGSGTYTAHRRAAHVASDVSWQTLALGSRAGLGADLERLVEPSPP